MSYALRTASRTLLRPQTATASPTEVSLRRLERKWDLYRVAKGTDPLVLSPVKKNSFLSSLMLSKIIPLKTIMLS